MQSLQTLIDEHIARGHLALVSYNTYKCVCHKTIKRSSFRKHIKSLFHTSIVKYLDGTPLSALDGVSGLSRLIHDAIEKNVLTDVGCGKYRCMCGSVVKRNSIRGHFKTKKHRMYTPPNNDPDLMKDCDICYEKRGTFIVCDVCYQGHCVTCNISIHESQDYPTCPFCRTPF